MKTSLEDYTRVVSGRYARRTGKQARRVLLDEYCQVTGFERKYAIKVLRGSLDTWFFANFTPPGT